MRLPPTISKENQMETEVRHITQRELANRWSKSEATIERYRSDGVGPKYLKIGGAVRYPLEDIEQLERGCLHFSPDEATYDDPVRLRDSQSNPRPQSVKLEPALTIPQSPQFRRP